jgi:hypothetical protein
LAQFDRQLCRLGKLAQCDPHTLDNRLLRRHPQRNRQPVGMAGLAEQGLRCGRIRFVDWYRVVIKRDGTGGSAKSSAPWLKNAISAIAARSTSLNRA